MSNEKELSEEQQRALSQYDYSQLSARSHNEVTPHPSSDVEDADSLEYLIKEFIKVAPKEADLRLSYLVVGGKALTEIDSATVEYYGEMREKIIDRLKSGASFQSGGVGKTLDQIKDEVAKSYGFESWRHYFSDHELVVNMEIMDQISELYAQSQQVKEWEGWIKIAEAGWPKIDGFYLTKRVDKDTARGWHYNETHYEYKPYPLQENDYRKTGWHDVLEYKLVERFPPSPTTK